MASAVVAPCGRAFHIQDDPLLSVDRRRSSVNPSACALQAVGQSAFGFAKGPSLNQQEVRQKLGLLRVEHRDLDHAIGALTQAGAADQLQLARLKKRKLKLRDQIAILEDYLIPDIIA